MVRFASSLALALAAVVVPAIRSPVVAGQETGAGDVDGGQILEPDAVFLEEKVDPGQPWQPVFHGRGCSQGIRYGRHVGQGGDGRIFYLRDACAGADGERLEVVHAFHATSDIQYVASERRDVFFLLGKSSDADGREVFAIERWRALRGTSTGPGPERSSRVVMKCRTVYRGTELGPLAGVGADPDGRFLLVAARNPARVLQLFPDGSSHVLFRATRIPHLEQVDMLTPAQHRTLGRVWMLEGGLEWTLLIDADNDGTFETFDTLSAAEWSARHGASGDWVDDFLGLE